jgi:hypothetical protein
MRAGAIGAIVAAGLSLLGLVPCFRCGSFLLSWLWYVAVGALAAYWLTPPRTTAAGAGQGAIAGVIAAPVGGVVAMIVGAIRFSLLGGSAAVISQIPPQTLRQLQDAGVDPSLFVSLGGILGISATCCVANLVFGALLGAFGGAILAAARPE